MKQEDEIRAEKVATITRNRMEQWNAATSTTLQPLPGFIFLGFIGTF
jgi:hypothetical protein